MRLGLIDRSQVGRGRLLAVAAIITLAAACGSGDSRANLTPVAPSVAAAPTTSPAASVLPTSQASPAPAAEVLVRCEDLPEQTYTSDDFRFTIACPSNFSWQTYGPVPGRLFHARAVDDKYLSGYPAGEVDMAVVANSGNSLRDWVASHTGQPYSGDANHLWDSTSNLTDTQIAGRPAVGFDFVHLGPDGPPSFQAVAFVLPEGSVLLVDWWAYSGDYRPTITGVAQQMIASIQPFGA